MMKMMTMFLIMMTLEDDLVLLLSSRQYAEVHGPPGGEEHPAAGQAYRPRLGQGGLPQDQPRGPQQRNMPGERELSCTSSETV